MTKSKYDIEGAYERALHEKNGVLPTVRDVAALSGASVQTTHYHLKQMGLDYARLSRREAALISARKMSAQAEDRFRQAYEEIVARKGRRPTTTEMSLALGLRLRSGQTNKMSRRLGLPLARWKDVMSSEARASAPPPADTPQRSTTPMREKMQAIKGGTACGPEEGWAHRPGEAYAAEERIMITCPVCGMRRLIAPRAHPFWIRNQAGAVIFVCSDACAGRITGGSYEN
ncbi:MAG: hypothetical protein PUH70_12065 [Clostridiales bacterium]|nr:hypothetical protein [Clostridiales bacterium]MDY5514805.1 hypothetical protein [Candidatus Ventricola sp.]